MSIMCSAVSDTNVVTFDCGMNRRGDPIYWISWYNGHKWMRARYTSFKPAYATWKMLSRMI